ncbi:2-C-methyl-D-erythritol 4-phosphate cytidylyltransferase [bacterium]|nr:2-C-methyl-D-erythritol 4-phosphate cytidylyltransferase [bacterium]
MNTLKTVFILPSAGIGKRMGAGMPKQFLGLAGKPLFFHPLEAFEAAPSVDAVIVVVPEPDVLPVQDLISKTGFRKVISVVPGGAERQDSVSNGLAAVPALTEIIGVHDGVRSLISVDLIEKMITAAREYGAAVPCIPVVDTIKTTDGQWIGETLDRSKLVHIQTPQVFKSDLLKEAYHNAAAGGFQGTDDASLVERAGHKVRHVEGDINNIKITAPLDMQIAHWILEDR